MSNRDGVMTTSTTSQETPPPDPGTPDSVAPTDTRSPAERFGLPYPGAQLRPRTTSPVVLRVAQLVLGLLGALGGYRIGRTIDFGYELGDPWQYLAYGGAIAGAGIVGWVVGGAVGNWLPARIRAIDRAADKRSAGELTVGAVGLVVGLVAAALAGVAVAKLPLVGPYLLLPAVLIVAYIFTRIAVRKHSEILRLVGVRSRGQSTVAPRVIDTSAIIDGRIIDVVRAHFLPGQIIIPAFVVEELHRVADSMDSEKRKRGRRGLDLIEELTVAGDQRVSVRSGDVPGNGVDAKLLNLTREIHGCLVTTDYALNKVARIQGIEVLNINDLANALKPVVLPGETLRVRIIREGREYDQGVGYLDDGTMVVVEGARGHVGGEPEDVEVTSVIQNPSGKMIFSRLLAPPSGSAGS